MRSPIEVTAQTTRRFILGKQGLWPGRRWRGKSGTASAIEACEHLQLDPLVIVARSHDLMLHSRVTDYQPTFFDALAYDDRAFFDWGGWLAVRPMHELPYWRVLMERSRSLPGQRQVLRHHGAAVEEMRALLRDGGVVSGRQFKASERTAISSYRGRKDTSLALYHLWRVGEAMTHHRERFERIYAASEVVAPLHLLESVSASAADRFLARKQVAFAGIGRVGPLSSALERRVAKPEERAIEADLIDAGEIVPVQVEGWRSAQFVLASDVPMLRVVARGQVPKQWANVSVRSEAEVALLSPLDPVSSRGRAGAIFGFDYVWEIYKRPADVKYGRYTLPILWGDDLVGRIDLKLDRGANTLVVNGAWVEQTATAARVDFRDALAAGVRRLMEFLAALRIDAKAVKNRQLRGALNTLNPRKRAQRRNP